MEDTSQSSQASRTCQPTQPDRTQWLLFCGLLVFVFLCAFFHVSDVDVGYHLRTGELVLETKGIPKVNTFAHTLPDEPWILHQWWPATVYYLVHQAGGLSALITFKALLAVLLMGVTWWTARRLTSADSLWPFWMVTIAVLMGRVRFFERPDLFSATLLAVLFHLELRFADNRRWKLIGLPLYMAFWANTHAGYIYGFFLLAAMNGGAWLNAFYRRAGAPGIARQEEAMSSAQPSDARRSSSKASNLTGNFKGPFQASIAIGVSLLAALVAVQLVHPYGWKVLWIPFEYAVEPFWKGFIAELAKPTLKQSPLLFTSLGVVAGLLWLTRRRFDGVRLCVLLGFGWLACSAQRSVLAWSLVAAPLAAQMACELWPVWSARVRGWQVVALPLVWAGLFAGLILPDPTFRFGTGLYPRFYPERVFDFLRKEVPAQKFFNDMQYGGPMLWKLHPQFPPFIDGRGEAYPVSFWREEYFPVMRGRPVWREVFERRGVTGVLLAANSDRTLPGLAQELKKDAAWAVVAFDDDTLVFLKRTPVNEAAIAKHEFRLLWPGDWTMDGVTPPTADAAALEAARILEMSPGSQFGRTAAARASLVRGDYATAAKLYGDLVQQPGASAGYWRDYGYALFGLGRLAEADTVFTYMADANLMRAYAHFMRHHVALRQNRIADARKHLASALVLEPNNAEYRAAETALKPVGDK